MEHHVKDQHVGTKPTVTTKEDPTGHQIMAEKPKDMPKTGGIARKEPPLIKRITLAEYMARRKPQEVELRLSTAAATMGRSPNAAIAKLKRDRTAEFIASGAKIHTLLNREGTSSVDGGNDNEKRNRTNAIAPDNIDIDCDVHNGMQRYQQHLLGHRMSYVAGHHGSLTALGPTRSPYAHVISKYPGSHHIRYNNDAASCFIRSSPRRVGTARPPVAGAVSFPTKALNDDRARDLYGGVARSQNGSGSNMPPIARSPSGSSDSGRADMRRRRYDHYAPAYDHYAPAYDHYSPPYDCGGQRQGHMGYGAAVSDRRLSVDSGYSSSSDRARKEEIINERHIATGADAAAVAGRRGAVEKAVGKGSEPAETHGVKRKRAHNDNDSIGQGENKRPSRTGCSQRALNSDIQRGVYSLRG